METIKMTRTTRRGLITPAAATLDPFHNAARIRELINPDLPAEVAASNVVTLRLQGLLERNGMPTIPPIEQLGGANSHPEIVDYLQHAPALLANGLRIG